MRRWPWDDDDVDVLSSGSDSVEETGEVVDGSCDAADHPPQELSPEDILLRSAGMYQDYMKRIVIPTHRGSVVPFSSWTGFASSLKKIYGQPLHYLTNILLKQWDQARYGSDGEQQSLDTIMHPVKAEATIWLVEEVHRLTASHHHIAKLWKTDSNRYASIDSVVPDI